MKEAKIWGDTTLIWCNESTIVHRINIIKGGYCSKHYHSHRSNLFHVESGKLQIDVWKENGVVDTTILCLGESTEVPPNVFHRFTALEETKALEVYWVKIDKEDIVREDQGGRDNVPIYFK